MTKPGKRSIFESVTVDRRAITVKIDPKIHADLEALEKRLATLGGTLSFNRTRIIEHALREAIDAGNAELDRVGYSA